MKVVRALGTIAFGALDMMLSLAQQWAMKREQARDRVRKSERILELEREARALRKASRW